MSLRGVFACVGWGGWGGLVGCFCGAFLWGVFVACFRGLVSWRVFVGCFRGVFSWGVLGGVSVGCFRVGVFRCWGGGVLWGGLVFGFFLGWLLVAPGLGVLLAALFALSWFAVLARLAPPGLFFLAPLLWWCVSLVAGGWFLPAGWCVLGLWVWWWVVGRAPRAQGLYACCGPSL